MEKTVTIVQARTGSSRLPNKVLMPVCSRPILWHIVNRLKVAKNVDSIVVATTDKSNDDAVEKFCKNQGVDYFRGQDDDVLDRFYQSAKKFSAGVVVRITGDCPLVDPGIVDEVVSLRAKSEADYAGNINPPTFPDGLDVEVFTFRALEEAWKHARYKYQREHVTSYITENRERFKTANLSNKDDLSGWRLTLDEPEDLEVVRIIYENLYNQKGIFGLQEIINFISKNPNILEINTGFTRDATYNIDDQ